MGEVMPPMLEASAMPMTRDLAKGVVTSMVLHACVRACVCVCVCVCVRARVI